VDYVATNFGLNTKYRASIKKPALLYFGDFDGSGRMQIVEAEYERETLYPIRGKSCSTAAMPFLGKKFVTYEAFAAAPLERIYTSEYLARARRLAATTLESSTLLNDGKGKFTVRPLPALAQISPGFGVVAGEFDGDGRADVYLVQNFFSPQWETGRMDGGLSQLLLGNGDGTFRAVEPRASGLVVPGDAKSAAICDLNGDALPDLAVGVNSGPAMALVSTSAGKTRLLQVRLVGRRGNPTAVGARVSLRVGDGRVQTAEVQAGGGYLSQSTAALWFGVGEAAGPVRVDVRWPDGKNSTLRFDEPQATLRIEQPPAAQ
jgi:hypothetical protein